MKLAKRGKQRAGGGALFPLHYFTFCYQPRHAHNYFTTQLGTSCSFDSPGLARNEPTPGKRSQGDSTPSVLSFFYEGIVIMKPLVTDYSKKAQHLRRCSPQTIRQPRVACTIVWQPWAIKNATPTALNNKKHNIICIILRDKLRHFTM
ncbi:hypothetical protein [Segatella salivae]|uniref:hypothetical protein n=1 Tax=Segatella salivae TaxID=228604 RepID=UPI00356B690E